MVRQKKTQSKIVPQSATHKMIQPTLVSFLGAKSRLEGQERVGRKALLVRTSREGKGACMITTVSPGNGVGRVRPPMRGNLEHLLLHEAQALAKDRGRPRQGSDHSEEKAWRQAGDTEKPGGRLEREKQKDQDKGRI